VIALGLLYSFGLSLLQLKGRPIKYMSLIKTVSVSTSCTNQIEIRLIF
jgi:hypothetical protein